ncbi:MAG: hypothetical protein AAGA77_21450 [Bacteroidota bacterium]
MDYQTKINYAKEIAQQLQQQISTDEIKSNLKSKGLYDPDIAEIMVSARKILGEKFQPKIKEYLIGNKQIHGSEEFSALDNEVIGKLVEIETQNLARAERKKITNLIKEGQPVEYVLQQIDPRFLPIEKAIELISKLQEVKRQNSGSGRMINIFGGIGLIVLTGIIAVAANRLFYVLPIIGLVMIVKGLTTREMEYDA